MNIPRTLLIEGWRSIPHSYAIINAFQTREFLKEPNLILRHHDVPFFNPGWKKSTGGLPKTDEDALAAIASPTAGEGIDAVFRIAFPYDLRPSSVPRIVVYGTSEYRCIPASYIAGGIPLKLAMENTSAVIVTPSNWSRDGFISSGADPDRVFVVPNGVDPEVFHPIPTDERAKFRSQLQGAFIFLSLGAMTGNKGIFELLRAFSVVARKYPNVRLVLKGIGELYDSRGLFMRVASGLTETDRQIIQTRITFVDRSLHFNDLARLYQLVDAYVSPYKGEGFNMPTLEAIASGLPVICTAGGATDDFTTDDFALRINARKIPHQQNEAIGSTLNVDLDHLVHQMMTAVESPHLAEKARVAGPAFVANGFTWPQIAQLLLRIIFGDEAFG